MNTKIVAIIVGVIVLGAGGVWLTNTMSTPESSAVPIRTTEQTIENARPAAQARPNTFGVMTPEEAAAQAAAEAAAAAATSTATTTSTSSDEELTETTDETVSEDAEPETPN